MPLIKFKPFLSGAEELIKFAWVQARGALQKLKEETYSKYENIEKIFEEMADLS